MHSFRRAAISLSLLILFVFPSTVEVIHSFVHNDEKFCHALYEKHYHAPLHHCQIWSAVPMPDSFVETAVTSAVIRILTLVYDTRLISTEFNWTFNHISFRAPPFAGF